MNNDHSLKAIVRQLVDDVSHLFRQELRLAQAEVSRNLEHAQRRLIMIVAGLLLGFCAVLILLQAIVFALADVMPAWIASVVVALVVGLCAFMMVHQGQSHLRAHDVVPKRTVRQVKQDKELVEEKMA
jgi:uncharacterized membrane protein YqjE